MAASPADGTDAPGAPLRRARDPTLQPRRRRDYRLDLREGRGARIRRLRPRSGYRADFAGLLIFFN